MFVASPHLHLTHKQYALHDKLGKSTGRYGFYSYDKCEYLWGNRYIFITHLDDVVVIRRMNKE